MKRSKNSADQKESPKGANRERGPDASELARADLARSGLGGDLQKMGMRELARAEALKFAPACPWWRHAPQGLACLLLEYRDVDGRKTGFWRVRRLEGAPANQWGGAPELSRYYQPEESRPYLWLSPAIRWPEALAGTREGKVRVVIVEGEKKAEKICRDGKGEVVAIGLGGVWNTGSKRQRIEVIPKGAPVADGSSRVPAVHKEVVGQSIRELGEGLPFLAGASRSDILPLMSAWYNVNASSSRSVNGVPTEPSAA